MNNYEIKIYLHFQALGKNTFNNKFQKYSKLKC